MRTYSGHSSAAASNALYRDNLGRGQTGLSVAFDLPTQTGYDADDALSRGEVGKVGVPIGHLGDMETLFEGIPLDRMNTSMTINATAPWLLALYVAAAERQGVAREALSGTTQNDLVKEFLSRGTYMLPPRPSMRLQTDVIAFTVAEMPRWNPVNICSYHLQEAGATPTLEVSYALANAMAVLDALRERGDVDEAAFPTTVGRISYFVNAGIRFVEEMVKLRVMARLWDRTAETRYGVTDERLRRFRYGVQVNSLGLTEPQPENNVYRIALEMLGVVLSKSARARAVQLPAWNEALGLPRPWDQQWSLRLQQIMAYETDLLEYEDLFDGSHVVAELEAELEARVAEELAWIEREGGVLAAVESGAMKQRLVEAGAARLREIESGEQVVVGVNRWQEGLPSPLLAGDDAGFMSVDEHAEAEQVARLVAWRAARHAGEAEVALHGLRDAATTGANIMPASIRCALAGVTTGEWGAALRDIFGEYRAPTGVSATMASSAERASLVEAREAVDAASERLGRRLKLLVGKPGLDGHSNGAEQVAVRARDAGIEVVYDGIRLTPDQIARAAEEEGVHAIGLSVLSGSHMALVPQVIAALEARGLAALPVIVGGIIPPEDRTALLAAGVARVFTPSDFDLDLVIAEIARAVLEGAGG
ncbi:MAG: protein meaA [Deltaproteobacteria bacterium]|nr:protein meaA [Deltaproteobacteria bacterium]MCB9785952.1 protein meaA [Deltaproteobacteria bacterium]